MKDLRKNIDIKGKDVEPLQILAVKAGKNLKNYIQDVLSEHVLKAKKQNISTPAVYDRIKRGKVMYVEIINRKFIFE